MTLVNGTSIGDAIANAVNALNPMSASNLATLKTYWEPMAKAILAQGAGGFTSYNIVTVNCALGVQSSVAHGMPSAPTLALVLGADGGQSVLGSPLLADLGSGNLGVTLTYGIIPSVSRISNTYTNAVALTSGIFANLISSPLVLGPGDYEVQAMGGFKAGGAATSINYIDVSVSTASLGSVPLDAIANVISSQARLEWDAVSSPIIPGSTGNLISLGIPSYQVTVNTGGSLSLWLTGASQFSAAALSGFGSIEARLVGPAPNQTANVTLLLLKQ